MSTSVLFEPPERPAISVLVNTARDDHPYVGIDWFIFEPTVRSLNRQEFRDFELVIVDALWSEERLRWLKSHAEFPFKYLDARGNRFIRHGLCAISSMKNQGLLHCEGDLVLFLDDCTELPKWHLRKVWDWFAKGYWPMSLTYYYETGRPKLLGESSRYVERFYGREYDKEGNLRLYTRLGEMVRDSRAKLVDGRGHIKALGQWFYGGSTAELRALLDINGLDEAFDGSKGLEDVDLGLRLERAGYTDLFVLDEGLWHVEHWHKSISERALWYKGPTPKCNYALLQYSRMKGVYRANTETLTLGDCEWIRDNVCPKCDNLHRCLNEEFRGRFYVECEGFHTWLKLQRTFDLRGLRVEL